ncbi:MAG: 5-formyltetrahydrofolate cyclo-ligase, partial [Bacteroidaceae bacterium]|nr:5-formyltetrahydrofolate cyclo-ligase [Bacteroidaceae bacterium]
LFASRLPHNIYKVGVCYPFQLVESVPTEPCDVQMDEVVTNAVNQ